MTTQELATAFAALCKAGKFEEAGKQYWSDDIVSCEPMAGDMGQAMTRGMKEMESMPKSGDADHDFAMMMRMHHQSAVEMAEIELRSGKDLKLHSMARNIISSQKKEIQQFDQWLAKHKPSDGHSSSK